MGKGRLEAFSDGVLAIIITVMVLELKVPHGDDLAALAPMCPVFLAYVVSFVYVAIYWNNHHHLLHTVKTVTPFVMWANMLLLFSLSLFPFVTSWVGEHPHAAWPAALYGVVLLLAGVAWLILERAIIRGGGGTLALAIGTDIKGKISAASYAAGVAAAFVSPWISEAVFAAVALMWIVPDRRIARLFGE
ncbi:MAG TPA: TMEM175 family protein [Polyangiaceae bacterium]|nr:TMEM175 family protein [Polyangiaceae bacterium]